MCLYRFRSAMFGIKDGESEKNSLLVRSQANSMALRNTIFDFVLIGASLTLEPGQGNGTGTAQMKSLFMVLCRN